MPEGDVFAVTVPVLDVEIEVVYEPVTVVVAQFVTVALAPVETDGLRLWLVEMHAVVVAVLERLCDSEVVGEFDTDDVAVIVGDNDEETLPVGVTVCDDVVVSHTE